jgi:uroporphyrinogen decarboxylase
MDMGELKKRYGDRLCFFGGVNAETLITGSSDEVRREVQSAIEQAASGGGLVLATSNVIPPGATYENYRAMRDAIHEYGTYQGGTDG